jgi:hypothetical protein
MARKPNKKTFYVDVRYVTTFTIPVDAENEEEAKRLAIEDCENDDDIDKDELELLDAVIN